MWKRVFAIAILAAAGGALLAWPRINDVETGRTPQYPDLQDRTYAASEERVAEAVKKLLPTLPRFHLVGAGHGPGGSSIQAERRNRLGCVD